MGYNLSAHSVVRNLPQLEVLASEQRTMRIPTDSPRRLAYKLREAVQAAKEHEQFRHLYDAIWPFYAFKEERGYVVAEYMGGASIQLSPDQKLPHRPSEIRPSRKTLPGMASLLEVISAAIKYPAEQTLHFPSAQLTESDRHKLHVWASEHEWAYLDHGGDGLSLTHDDVPEELQWQPEEEE